MSQFESFRYRCLDEVLETLNQLGIAWPRSDDFSVLFEPVEIHGKRLANRFVIQPMEGCDCNPDGSPTALVRRRYRRFAAGGAGMLWCEACAVVPEGRANPRQMMLTDANVGKMASMLDDCRAAAQESMGSAHQPLFILQLTHSGRYSKPEGKPAPIIAHHSSVLDPLMKIPADYPLISDEQLERLQDAYLKAASLAYEAGFDGVDVKACHGYLLAELLASFTRTGSRYGGEEFESRTRMVREIHQRIHASFPSLIVTSRMNVYDPIPYPYGWGCDRGDYRTWDLREPIKLVGALEEQGAECVNITIGNPYYLPHYNRPYDTPVAGFQPPEEHPFVGVHRMLEIVREIQQAKPEVRVVGSGYSYLRQFMPWFASGLVRAGWVSLVGMGRGALAYPDFVKDLAETGSMNPFKTCITCSNCTQIMRDGGTTGCVIRDDEVYGAVYREGRRWVEDTIRRA
ncbi:MAG TPA: NADH:flavin oxidoreductase, partial [bacterium]|nr:NADH:flavin oxidoreductase [bacterium]